MMVGLSDPRWQHEYSVHVGVDCPGKDITSLWGSLGQCGKTCDLDLLCVGFTYLGVERGEPRCWLKYNCETHNRKEGPSGTYRHKGKYRGVGQGN